jgi:ABC-2 type transport system permease protein
VKSLVITLVNVRRLLRERSTIFFVFVFPMLLILVIGAAFGGSYRPRVGVVAEDNGPYAAEFSAAVAAVDELEVSDYAARDALLGDLERGRLEMGVVIPPDYDAQLNSGATAEIEYVGTLDQTSVQLRATIEAVAADQSAIFRAARLVTAESLAPFPTAVGIAETVAAAAPGIDVVTTTAGTAVLPDTLGQFDLGAPQELLLFVFLTSLAGSAALIQTRRLGVARRMVASPTSIGQILVGETGGRFTIAMIQGIFIMVGAALVFDVRWGNLLGAAVLLILIALTGAGGGMLMGALFDNDEQAGSMGVFIGLGLAALGGCMVPLEIFPSAMKTVAHFTPHAWGLDGFAELIRRNGNLASISTDVLVLLGYAVVLLGLATWRLRVKLTR